MLQGLLKYKGYEFQQDPNGTLRKALEDSLIQNHDAWRRINKTRTITSHTYNTEDALNRHHKYTQRIRNSPKTAQPKANRRKTEYRGKQSISLIRMYGLNNTVIDKIRNVFSTHHNIDKAIIFGSHAKGNHTDRYRLSHIRQKSHPQSTNKHTNSDRRSRNSILNRPS